MGLPPHVPISTFWCIKKKKKKKFNHLLRFILFVIFDLIKLVAAPCVPAPLHTFCFPPWSCSPVIRCVFSFLWPPHSVPSSFFSQFLMFLFISIVCCSWLSVGPGPQLLSCPLLWVESGLVPLPYLCHLYMPPPRQHCLDEPRGCACIPDSDCLHAYKGCVFFLLISECI